MTLLNRARFQFMKDYGAPAVMKLAGMKKKKRRGSMADIILIVLTLGLMAGSQSFAASTLVIPDDTAPKTLKTSAFTLGSTGTVVSAVAGKRIKVYAVKLFSSASGTVTVNFRDGNTTNIEGGQTLAASSGYTETINPPYSLFSTSSGTSLDLVTVGTGTVGGRISYWDDDSN